MTRFIIKKMDNKFIFYSSNVKGKGKDGYIKGATWLGKSITISGTSLNKGSLIDRLNTLEAEPNKKLKKGWFFGYGAAKDSKVKEAMSRLIPDLVLPEGPKLAEFNQKLAEYDQKAFTFTNTLLSLPPKPGEFKNNPISKEAAQELLDKYPDLRDLAGRNNKTTGDLIMLSFDNGLPMLRDNSQELNETFKQELNQLLFLINDEKKPIEQARLMKILTSGFIDCQPVMQRTVNGLLTELLSFEDDLPKQVRIKFQEFKDQQLEALIAEVHPNAYTADDTSPKQQMPHLKSGYLLVMGEEFGLSGIEEAHYDINRNSLSGQDIEAFKKSYLAKLQEFNNFINDLSNFYSHPGSYEGRALMEKIQEWKDQHEDEEVIPQTFAYHEDSKADLGLYKVMRDATEAQVIFQTTPYISPAEIKLMLEVMELAVPID